MAYFPNGASGMAYQEEYCMRCENWKQRKDEDTQGCPIWDLHMRFNYEDNKKVREMLNSLIPLDRKGIYPQKCRMFDWNGDVAGQMKFEKGT